MCTAVVICSWIIITSRMRIAHTASVMFHNFCPSFCPQGWGGGGVWVSKKVHSENIGTTKVLMSIGGGCWVSGKVHYEHIVATKVLMPGGGGGVRESAL